MLRYATKFDPFLSCDCARVKGKGRNPIPILLSGNTDPRVDLKKVMAECRNAEAAAVDLTKFAAVRDRVRQLVKKVVSQELT